MRTFALLLCALVVLGCQKKEDPPDTGVSAPKTAEPATEKPVEVEEPTASDPVPETSSLVAKVRGLAQIRSVEETETGIRITWPLEAAVTVDESSPPPVVSDAMMFATFYTAPLLYKRLPELDGLQQVFTYKGKTIGDIQMTRASFESLDADRALQGLPDGKVKRAAYRNLLKQLPQGAVDIEKKYWPRG